MVYIPVTVRTQTQDDPLLFRSNILACRQGYLSVLHGTTQLYVTFEPRSNYGKVSAFTQEHNTFETAGLEPATFVLLRDGAFIHCATRTHILSMVKTMAVLKRNNHDLLLSFSSVTTPEGIAVYKDNVFWCDSTNNQLSRKAADGSGSVSTVSATFDGLTGGLNGCRDIDFHYGKKAIIFVS